MAQFEIAKDRIITVFGGSGFLGRYVVRALAQRGWRVKVASRRPDLAFHLQPLGRVGQIHAVQANVRYPASLAAALQGSDAVVNLVGILAEQGMQNFEAVQFFGARAVARAAAEHGITQLVQMSAIGAMPEGTSDYARTKGRAEEAVREAVPGAVVIRPSVLFGPEDDFFNRFAALARISPVLPLIGGGATRFQPAFVGDVAEAVARVLEGRGVAGITYELGGPDVRSFRDIMAFICATTGRKRVLLPVAAKLAYYPAMLSEIANGLALGALPSMFQLTRDQLKLLESDNIVSPQAEAEARTFAGLGVQPQSLEVIAPTYLYRFRKTGQFDRTRQAS
jgi:uncharacterized protein YbjT (DUF2867 family)